MIIPETLEVRMWLVHLGVVPVADLALVALLSSEGVAAVAAARVEVTLLGHRADRTAATVLHTHTHKNISR